MPVSAAFSFMRFLDFSVQNSFASADFFQTSKSDSRRRQSSPMYLLIIILYREWAYWRSNRSKCSKNERAVNVLRLLKHHIASVGRRRFFVALPDLSLEFWVSMTTKVVKRRFQSDDGSRGVALAHQSGFAFEKRHLIK